MRASVRYGSPPEGPPPLQKDLIEFAILKPLPAADPTFREELRASLWRLLSSLLGRFRR